MIQSTSQRCLRRQKTQSALSRSISQRCIYINQEVSANKNDLQTTFQSPFKNGQKNQTFRNPTFMSSHLFYPNQWVDTKENLHNIKFNQNQQIRRKLYEKRMNKQDQEAASIHSAVARSKQCRRINQETQSIQKQNKQRSTISRGTSRINRNQQLVRQLENLISFRSRNQQKKKERRKRVNRLTEVEHQPLAQVSHRQNIKQNNSYVFPVYAQKFKQQKQDVAQCQNRQNLRQWIKITNKIKNLKQSNKKQSKRAEQIAMNNFIQNNRQRNMKIESTSRKNANVLAQILKEQIKICQKRQQRQRKTRVNFN